MCRRKKEIGYLRIKEKDTLLNETDTNGETGRERERERLRVRERAGE